MGYLFPVGELWGLHELLQYHYYEVTVYERLTDFSKEGHMSYLMICQACGIFGGDVVKSIGCGRVHNLDSTH